MRVIVSTLLFLHIGRRYLNVVYMFFFLILTYLYPSFVLFYLAWWRRDVCGRCQSGRDALCIRFVASAHLRILEFHHRKKGLGRTLKAACQRSRTAF